MCSSDLLTDLSTSVCVNFEPQQSQEHTVNRPEDVNPNDLLRELDTVQNILAATIQSIDDLSTLHPETSAMANMPCCNLAIQLVELKPIVIGYARVWSATSMEIPLDPGLFAWLYGARIKALALQVELQEEVRRTLQQGHSERGMEQNHVVCGICDDLKTLEQHMDDFLPIMRV